MRGAGGPRPAVSAAPYQLVAETPRRSPGELVSVPKVRGAACDERSAGLPSFGLKKPGAAFGYTRVRGYHPIPAVRARADTGEVLHIRLSKGSANISRGFGRFLDELLARVERSGAGGPKLLRADRGFLEQPHVPRGPKARSIRKRRRVADVRWAR